MYVEALFKITKYFFQHIHTFKPQIHLNSIYKLSPYHVKAHGFSITETNQLIVFEGIIAAYLEDHKKTICLGENAQFLFLLLFQY
jgi:hypothetical protein